MVVSFFPVRLTLLPLSCAGSGEAVEGGAEGGVEGGAAVSPASGVAGAGEEESSASGQLCWCWCDLHLVARLEAVLCSALMIVSALSFRLLAPSRPLPSFPSLASLPPSKLASFSTGMLGTVLLSRRRLAVSVSCALKSVDINSYRVKNI